MQFTSLLLPLTLPLLGLATHLTAYIPSTSLLPSPNTLPPSTCATLTTLGQRYTAPLQRDARFVFRNVSAGSYLLDVHCRDWAFAPLRVDVGEGEKVEVWQTFRGNEWENKGEKRGVPVELRVVGGREYYEKREGFSPLSLLKNPMILLGGAALLLVVGMPYMMDSMDPEMRAEFEEQSKKSPLAGGMSGGGNPLQNFDMAAWMAGKTAPAATVEDGEATGQGQGQGQERGQGGKRRRG
ncbi:MAG: hypothetical protein M1827_003507 [Pycnora praestabilis]|nr:MAG: hypothetical protein M1827_003507 [Pycnora praestabilis]